MKTFLQETVFTITQNTQNFKNTVCIVPSERAGIYLKKAFKEGLPQKAFFLPKIISVENFIKEISALESINQVSLIFEFFNIYKQVYVGDNPDTFEKFIGWATVVLQDFNEIDRHLVDPLQIFSYLTDIQKIKDWSPAKDKATDTMSNYMSFVGKLAVYYQKLQECLLAKKVGYQGLIYKKAYQKHQEYLKAYLHKNFHFIGFNALNKAEEKIFKSFLSLENNHAYWDVDAYYFNGKHEAGSFIRTFFKEWDCLPKNHHKKWIQHHFSKKKNIKILASPLQVTGIKSMTSLLVKELVPKETALVMADETVLPVVLNAIPKEMDKINITMGYQLSNAPLLGLFQAVFELHLNKEKLQKNAFYYQDVISFLGDPYVCKITESKSEQIIQKITQNNLVFISQDLLHTFFKEHHIKNNWIVLFDDAKDTSLFLENLFQLIQNLEEASTGIELLYVEGFKKVFQELANLNATYKYINNVKVLHQIFKKTLSLETIDFKGDALEGMQLMGVLETRCLDFKNVMMTSLNEGVLPKGGQERSFISHEVKKHFNMPTYLAKDAIYAYHFYRLLQRAENIYLQYNTKNDDFGGGEMSRFLTQLMIEKEQDITHSNVVATIYKNHHVAIEVAKTPKVMELLSAYFKQGISPSRITDYMNDPLSFYKKIVLKIREIDKVEEEVAHNTLGSIVHDSLEFLYKSYLGKILVAEDVKKMKLEAKSIVASKFKEHFKQGDTAQGKNHLINEVAIQFVMNFLNKELSEITQNKEIIVLSLEQEYQIKLETPKGHPFALKGKIDRVDQVNGVRRIVDYKTGNVQSSDLKLADLTLATTDYKHHKVVQVMTYALLYAQTTNFDLDTHPLQAGMYSFKNLNQGFLSMDFSSKGERSQELLISKSHIANFKQGLFELVDEILDNNLTFVENVDRAFKKEV